MQDYVLARNVALLFAVKIELERGRHLEPGFARRHGGCHVRRAHARRERAQRAVGAGVRVRADYRVAGNDKPFFGKQGVLDAHFAHLEIVGYVHFVRKFAHGLALLRRLDVLVGREVVGHQRNLVAIEHAVAAEFLKLTYRHGAGDVVAENEVELRLDELPRLHLAKPCVRRENLLSHRHCHNIFSF